MKKSRIHLLMDFTCLLVCSFFQGTNPFVANVAIKEKLVCDL